MLCKIACNCCFVNVYCHFLVNDIGLNPKSETRQPEDPNRKTFLKFYNILCSSSSTYRIEKAPLGQALLELSSMGGQLLVKRETQSANSPRYRSRACRNAGSTNFPSSSNLPWTCGIRKGGEGTTGDKVAERISRK